MHSVRKNNRKIFLTLLILDVILACGLFIKSNLKIENNVITAHLAKDIHNNCDSLLINTYLTKIIVFVWSAVVRLEIIRRP